MSTLWCMISAGLAVFPTHLIAVDMSDIEFIYSDPEKKEIVLRRVYELRAQKYTVPYKLDLQNVGSYRTDSEESVVERYLSALVRGDIDVMLQVSDHEHEQDVLIHSNKDEIRNWIELASYLYKDKYVVITDRGNILGKVVLSVVSYTKSGGERLSRLPFYARKENKEWKISLPPYLELRSAISFGFPAEGDEIVYKSSNGISTLPPHGYKQK